MELTWVFFKVTLQSGAAFPDRQLELLERFLNADTYLRKWRGSEYRYQLYDVEAVGVLQELHVIVFGHLTRAPKVAHGRSLDEVTRRSQEGAVNVPEIADYTEFIYDLTTCVLAVHRRAPFTTVNALAVVWRHLLGGPPPEAPPGEERDIHVEPLRDAGFVGSELDTGEPLVEAKLTYARPNPGSGDDSLGEITLGLLGEEINADEVKFDARTKGGGSLEKSSGSFLRRSITSLLEMGYLKKGVLRIGHRVVDVLRAREKQRETSGYARDDSGEPLLLRHHVIRWFTDLFANQDIYGGAHATENDEDHA